jgi:hypothetical protein
MISFLIIACLLPSLISADIIWISIGFNSLASLFKTY